MNSYNGFTPDERTAAFAITKAAWADGTLTPPTRCEACGQSRGIIGSHDEDYSRPLDYYEVCFACHMMIHCRFGNRRWAEYLELLDRGAVFTTAAGWPNFKEHFLSRPLANSILTMGPPRPPSFLHALPTTNLHAVPECLPSPKRQTEPAV